MENDGRNEFDGFDEPLKSCPEEDRSWKRRQKRNNSDDVGPMNTRNGNSRANNVNDRKPIRERLGKLDSQGNHFLQSKPR